MSELGDVRVELMAKAAWDEVRRRVPAVCLMAWEDETEALRQDWRAYIMAAVRALRASSLNA